MTENDARATHFRYLLLNAALTLRSASTGWQLSLIGRNLTDVYIRPNTFSSPLTGARTGTGNSVPSDVFGVVGPPREIALQLRWNL